MRLFIFMVLVTILSAFLSSLLPSAAFAKKGCYTPSEAEAEQGLRIHSELMVIGLNCQHMTPTGWKNFYLQYREFTNAHELLFSEYEKRLITYYKDQGVSNAERTLHDLRTSMANKVSNDVASMRPDIFCANYAPRIPKAAAMTQADLRKWASTFYEAQPLSRPFCQ